MKLTTTSLLKAALWERFLDFEHLFCVSYLITFEDDSLCVFDCEEDLCNRSGYDGYPDDGKFAHSVKSPPRIVLQKISYELNKSIKNEYDGETDASVRQKFETRKTQWCYACTATFSGKKTCCHILFNCIKGDELIQNTDCMEISEQSLALPILDYNCATKMDRQRFLSSAQLADSLLWL